MCPLKDNKNINTELISLRLEERLESTKDN